jgi:enterochelin esterase family protein
MSFDRFTRRTGVVAVAIAATLVVVTGAEAQEQKERAETRRPRFGGQRGPVVVSPQVTADQNVMLRIHAPKAESVTLATSDLPGNPGEPRPLAKGENDIWELKLGPVSAGTYRYTFNVDGVAVVDPRNQAVSESNGTVWSVLHVPGADFMDTADVPHGAVARIHYRSSVLGRTRRMHVYTPPGYETSTEKYPVLYLLHGASDSDDSWTSVGRANFILDNLVAAGNAKPMIVVMPAGHTGPFSFSFATPPPAEGQPGIGNLGFEQEFAKDIRPYVEKHYRVAADRGSRAIAGLSMGGAQTLDIALANLKDYGYVGVFSSGLLFRNLENWERDNKDLLGDAAVKDGLKLFWFATGSQDFLIAQSRQTVELFKNQGFKPVFKESDGGHTWINWQQYLNEFAPQLFR